MATQEAVHLTKIALDQLHLAGYQRVLRNKWKELAKNFRPAVAWPLSVSLRDGVYWVVDGQHRMVAAVDQGYTHALCKVDQWTYEEEAVNFKAFNKDRGALRAKDAFHADLSWGEPIAVEIDSIVRQEGYVLSLGFDPPTANSIGAIGTLETIYRTNHPEGLRRVLSTARKTWGDNPSAVKNDMLLGIAAFLRRYPDVNITGLAEKLQNNGVSVFELMQDGALLKRAGMGTMANCIGRAILGKYNQHKSTKRLPNLFDRAEASEG